MISCAFHVPTPTGREEEDSSGEIGQRGEDEGQFGRLREVERSPIDVLDSGGALAVLHRVRNTIACAG